jgi:hypothetical protein
MLSSRESRKPLNADRGTLPHSSVMDLMVGRFDHARHRSFDVMFTPVEERLRIASWMVSVVEIASFV